MPFLTHCSHSGLICLQRLSGERPSSIYKADVACAFTLFSHAALSHIWTVELRSAKCASTSFLSILQCFIYSAVCTHVYTQMLCADTLLSEITAVFATLQIFQLPLKTVYLPPYNPHSRLFRLCAASLERAMKVREPRRGKERGRNEKDGETKQQELLILAASLNFTFILHVYLFSILSEKNHSHTKPKKCRYSAFGQSEWNAQTQTKCILSSSLSI